MKKIINFSTGSALFYLVVGVAVCGIVTGYSKVVALTKNVTEKDKTYNVAEINKLLRLFHMSLNPQIPNEHLDEYLPRKNYRRNQDDENIVECKNFLSGFCSDVTSKGFVKLASSFNINRGIDAAVNYIFFNLSPAEKQPNFRIKYFTQENRGDKEADSLIITPIDEDVMEIKYKMNIAKKAMYIMRASSAFTTFDKGSKLSLSKNGLDFFSHILKYAKSDPEAAKSILKKEISMMNIIYLGQVIMNNDTFKLFEIENNGQFRVILVKKEKGLRNSKWSVIAFKRKIKDATNVFIVRDIGTSGA